MNSRRVASHHVHGRGSQRPCEQMSSEDQIADNEERMLEKHSHGFFSFFFPPPHVDPRERRRCCQAMTRARSLKTHRRSCDRNHEINTTEKDAVCTIPFIYCPINVIRVNYPVSSPSN